MPSPYGKKTNVYLHDVVMLTALWHLCMQNHEWNFPLILAKMIQSRINEHKLKLCRRAVYPPTKQQQQQKTPHKIWGHVFQLRTNWSHYKTRPTRQLQIKIGMFQLRLDSQDHGPTDILGIDISYTFFDLCRYWNCLLWLKKNAWTNDLKWCNYVVCPAEGGPLFNN